MWKSDSKHRLPKKTTSESKVQRCLSETDKSSSCAMSDNSEGSHLDVNEDEINVDDDLNHSYPQITELELSSEDDFCVEAIQNIIAMHHQIDNLQNKVQKLAERVSALEAGNQKMTEEETCEPIKSNQEQLGFLKKENQYNNGKVLSTSDIKYTIRPMSTQQDRPLTLDYLLSSISSQNLSTCLKRRIRSQPEEEPEEHSNISTDWNEFLKRRTSSQPEDERQEESEVKPEKHSNIYLQYKLRELHLSNMSETSLALNKEWPVQLFYPLWPQKKFTKCDCLKQFRK